MHVQKNWSDKISGGNQDGSDIFQNWSDIIRYPTVILSPGCLYLNWNGRRKSKHGFVFSYVMSWVRRQKGKDKHLRSGIDDNHFLL